MSYSFYALGKLRTMVDPLGQRKLMRMMFPYLGSGGMDYSLIFRSQVISLYSQSCLLWSCYQSWCLKLLCQSLAQIARQAQFCAAISGSIGGGRQSSSSPSSSSSSSSSETTTLCCMTNIYVLYNLIIFLSFSICFTPFSQHVFKTSAVRLPNSSYKKRVIMTISSQASIRQRMSWGRSISLPKMDNSLSPSVEPVKVNHTATAYEMGGELMRLTRAWLISLPETATRIDFLLKWRVLRSKDLREGLWMGRMSFWKQRLWKGGQKILRKSD